MISCELFRTRFAPGTDDAEVLEHLRSCDRCLDLAAHADPDVMFRALGGDELPPGGVDLFVDEVMQQVRVRGAETTATRGRLVSWPRRLAVAATLVAGITGALLFRGADTPVPQQPTVVQIARAVSPVTAAKLTTKPIVETYESENATIVEMPAQAGDDVQMVMIFDENLPVDL
jgi:hypothetical protein